VRLEGRSRFNASGAASVTNNMTVHYDELEASSSCKA